VVVRQLKELLLQLVGARSLAFYAADEARGVLVAFASEGVDLATLPTIQLHDASLSGAAAPIERAYLTGVPYVLEGDTSRAGPTDPAACIPMRVEERMLGVIVVYSLLEQKAQLVAVDRELFKLLGAHAGPALVAAHLFSGDGKLPTVDTLRELAS
jgi:hypothetical protein